jgi:hypothetical protein
MKNLMKFSLIALIGLSGVQSYAQLGIKGGLTLSNLLEKDNDNTYSDNYKWLPGFHAGVTLGLPVNEYFAIEPGVIFTTKGMKMEDKFDVQVNGQTYSANLSGKAHLNYIDVPVNLKLYYPFADNFRVYAEAGPYAGYGLSGKIESTLEVGGDKQTDKQDIQWGNSDNDDLVRFDYGVTFGAGFIFNFVQLGVSYDLGLANISSVIDNGAMTKNRVLKISMGLMFGE